MKTEVIKDFLNAMSDSIEKENIELFKKVIDSSEIKEFNSPEEFYYAVLYPWEKIIDGFLKSTLKANQDVEFIFKHYKYIDRHFNHLFIEHEGSACSSDKSRNIVNSLLKFYATGEMIEFNYNAEYTYHLPKKIFKSHEHIVEFYEGLKRLFYGHPQRYLKALKLVL